jgi:hypothetical protein
MDEDRYMDDDAVFMSIWLSFWVIWNGRRILAPELREDSEYRERARDTFSLPEMKATVRAWDLPLIGRGGFKPSPRTIRPIEWFWNSLEGARDLAHCQQPDHAARFQIRFDLPRGPSWRQNPPKTSTVHLAGRGSKVHTAEETGPIIPLPRNNNGPTKNGSGTDIHRNKDPATDIDPGCNESNAIDQTDVQIETFGADIMGLLGLTPDGMELNEQVERF